MLTAIRLVEGRYTQIQCHLDRAVVEGRREPQQGTHHLTNSAVVIVHIGQRIAEIRILMECGFIVEGRWLVIHKIFQVNIQCLGNFIQSFHINGDRTVLIFG